MNPDNSKLNIQNSKLERCISDATVAVIGLGYVGLPLAVTFGKNIDHHWIRSERNQDISAA